MRSGKILREAVEHRIDRRHEKLALWEEGNPGQIDLPWMDATKLDPKSVGDVVASAGSAILVMGATATSRKLFEHALAGLGSKSRLYVYADRSLESDPQFLKRLAAEPDRVLVRLGHRPPADWLVGEKGQNGLLVLGDNPGVRRWVISVERERARSLYEVFRILFWFHASREALADEKAKVMWQPPLAAPYPDPGKHVDLPAGVLSLTGAVSLSIPEAEVRVTPVTRDPGRAGIVIMPPRDMFTSPAKERVEIEVPRQLTQRGSQVVWVDTGLPTTALTRERVVIDLVEHPIAIQLEWPRADAIDLFHRFERMVRQPAWTFYPDRRLDAIRGRVLVGGAHGFEAVQAREEIPVAKDVVAPLLDFDSAKPESFPSPSLLSLEVVYKWHRVPAQRPPGAKKAKLVQQWTAVDEWAGRQATRLREALDGLNTEEQGVLGRLKKWFRGADDASRERREIEATLAVLAEVKPSQDAPGARSRIGDLSALSKRIVALGTGTRKRQQEAENAAAEEEQRAAWSSRVASAEKACVDERARLARIDAALDSARLELQQFDSTLNAEVERLRQERRVKLDGELAPLDQEIVSLKAALEALSTEFEGRPPNDQRKKLTKEIHVREEALARKRKELEGADKWSPSPHEIGHHGKMSAEVRAKITGLESERKSCEQTLQAAEARTKEEFHFRSPSPLPEFKAQDAGQPPVVPDEALPDFGELWEHEGLRYLEIKTWEQFPAAHDMAARLKAELVAAAPDHS